MGGDDVDWMIHGGGEYGGEYGGADSPALVSAPGPVSDSSGSISPDLWRALMAKRRSTDPQDRKGGDPRREAAARLIRGPGGGGIGDIHVGERSFLPREVLEIAGVASDVAALAKLA